LLLLPRLPKVAVLGPVGGARERLADALGDPLAALALQPVELLAQAAVPGGSDRVPDRHGLLRRRVGPGAAVAAPGPPSGRGPAGTGPSPPLCSAAPAAAIRPSPHLRDRAARPRTRCECGPEPMAPRPRARDPRARSSRR